MLATTGVVGLAPPCFACTCVERTKAEQYADADVVFTGVVSKIDKQDGTVATLKVSSVEKGGAAPEQEVVTESDEAACGFNFVEGDRFQVYADQGEDGRFHTGICAGTTPLDAKQKPYISNERPQTSPSATPAGTRSREEVIAGLPPQMREQLEAAEEQQAARARRDYVFAAGLWVVIVTLIVLVWRRRRKKLRSAS